MTHRINDARHGACRVNDLEQLIGLVRAFCPYGSVVEGPEALMLIDEIDKLRRGRERDHEIFDSVCHLIGALYEMIDDQIEGKWDQIESKWPAHEFRKVEISGRMADDLGLVWTMLQMVWAFDQSVTAFELVDTKL